MREHADIFSAPPVYREMAQVFIAASCSSHEHEIEVICAPITRLATEAFTTFQSRPFQHRVVVGGTPLFDERTHSHTTMFRIIIDAFRQQCRFGIHIGVATMVATMPVPREPAEILMSALYGSIQHLSEREGASVASDPAHGFVSMPRADDEHFVDPHNGRRLNHQAFAHGGYHHPIQGNL